MRRFTHSLFAILLLTMSGCGIGAKSEPMVIFRSLDQNRAYSQKFSQAIFAPSDSGQTQIVLIDTGLDELHTPPGEALQPSTTPPLKQIMAIRVLWRPARAAKPADETSTNAAIDWYVIAEDSAGDADRLHYQGTGFVMASVKGDRATIEIHDATLDLVDRAGDLQDPLGRTRLSASLVARRDDALVNATLGDLQQRFARRASEHQGPPPRSPGGP